MPEEETVSATSFQWNLPAYSQLLSIGTGWSMFSRFPLALEYKPELRAPEGECTRMGVQFGHYTRKAHLYKGGGLCISFTVKSHMLLHSCVLHAE